MAPDPETTERAGRAEGGAQAGSPAGQDKVYIRISFSPLLNSPFKDLPYAPHSALAFLLDSLQPYWRALHASQATLAPSQISSPCLPLYRPLLTAFSTSLPAELWAQILKSFSQTSIAVLSTILAHSSNTQRVYKEFQRSDPCLQSSAGQCDPVKGCEIGQVFWELVFAIRHDFVEGDLAQIIFRRRLAGLSGKAPRRAASSSRQSAGLVLLSRWAGRLSWARGRCRSPSERNSARRQAIPSQTVARA